MIFCPEIFHEIFEKFHDVEQQTTSIKIHPIQTNKSADSLYRSEFYYNARQKSLFGIFQ